MSRNLPSHINPYVQGPWSKIMPCRALSIKRSSKASENLSIIRPCAVTGNRRVQNFKLEGNLHLRNYSQRLLGLPWLDNLQYHGWRTSRGSDFTRAMQSGIYGDAVSHLVVFPFRLIQLVAVCGSYVPLHTHCLIITHRNTEVASMVLVASLDLQIYIQFRLTGLDRFSITSSPLTVRCVLDHRELGKRWIIVAADRIDLELKIWLRKSSVLAFPIRCVHRRFCGCCL